MESNLLKLHRQNPDRNGRHAAEAIQMSLLTVDGYLRETEYDYGRFASPENQALLHGLLMSFDPYTNPEIHEVVMKNGQAFNAKEYFTLPVKCLIRIEKSIEADENKNFKDRLFSIHLNTDTWEVHKKNIENKDIQYEELIDEFMNDLDEELKEKLRKRVAKAKAYGKDNPLEWLDELDLEDGSCFGFSEVFGERDVDKFLFEYKGTNYFVDDQYCTNPECKCNEVVLTFVDIIPGREAQEPKFVVRMPFGTGSYEVEYSQNVGKDEMEQIIKRFKEHIKNDFGLMRTRYMQMKEFGKKRIERKKQSGDMQRVISPKVGRNDPCSCGSGKKYKKCCGK